MAHDPQVLVGRASCGPWISEFEWGMSRRASGAASHPFDQFAHKAARPHGFDVQQLSNALVVDRAFPGQYGFEIAQVGHGADKSNCDDRSILQI